MGSNLRNIRINSRVTPDGRFKILFLAPLSPGNPGAAPWGDITITPSDPAVRAAFAAAYPARGTGAHDIFFNNVDTQVEILFADPTPE